MFWDLGQGYRLIREGLQGFKQNLSWYRHLGLTIPFDRKPGPHGGVKIRGANRQLSPINIKEIMIKDGKNVVGLDNTLHGL